MKLLLKRSCFCCFLGFSCGSRIAQVRFKITHPGISIDVLASPCSPVLTAQPLDVVLRSKGTRRKKWLERNLSQIPQSTHFLFQVACTHRNLVLLLAARIPRPLGRDVVLSSTGPVLVILELIWNKLFAWLFNHRLRFELFIGECSGARIKVTPRRCEWKCWNIKY